MGLDTFDSTRSACDYGPVDPALDWSHELGVSASRRIKKLDGCDVFAPDLNTLGNDHTEIDEIAQYEKHARHYVYPQRMDWANPREMVWDWLANEYKNQKAIRNVFNHRFTQIGVACNCHPTFGQFCIIELGRNVKGIKQELSHSHESHEGKDFRDHYHGFVNDTLSIEQFRMPNDVKCPTGRRDELCVAKDTTEAPKVHVTSAAWTTADDLEGELWTQL